MSRPRFDAWQRSAHRVRRCVAVLLPDSTLVIELWRLRELARLCPRGEWTIDAQSVTCRQGARCVRLWGLAPWHPGRSISGVTQWRRPTAGAL